MSIEFLSTEPCCWQRASDIQLEPTVRDWLLDESSLTAKLRSLPGSFAVELIGQTAALPFANERSEFQQTLFVREYYSSRRASSYSLVAFFLYRHRPA